MKKIVSIISIFAIMMSLCVTSFANDTYGNKKTNYK